MSRGEEGALADLAASVVDGDTIDWTGAAGRIPDAERRLIPHLQLVQSISQVYRTLPVVEPALASEVPTPTRWGNFLLLERIGEGTTGEVYRAWDAQLHRDVALKLLRHDRRSRTDAQERVLEEARRLARVRHEHVVSVYGAEAHDGRVGLWMELVRGESLDERVRTHGRVGGDQAASIGQQLCSALAAVHSAGLLHRDVKAQNGIQEPSGRIVLMDFGTGEDLRRAGGTTRMAGTPLYLAPEIFKGDPATVQTDIYSLGVLLFYLVTGEFPVSARTMPELARAHRDGTRRRLAELRPDLPAAFVAAVERALESDPARRYRTAGEMDIALRPSPEIPTAATAASKPLSAASRWGFAAAATLLLALTVALIVWTRQTTAPPPGAAVKRLAVAPMALIDPRTAPPFFAEGLTDQLISTLGQIKSLRVKIGPGMDGSSGRASPEEVDAILETTLLAADPAAGSSPRVRVNARLIAAGTGTLMWTGTFNDALGDTFALQAAMAREIATAVNAAITADEDARLRRPRQTTPDADMAFLEGRAHIDGYGVDDTKRALDAFQRAIKADPKHAAAHAGAARAYFTLGFANDISQPVARALALAAAQKALELDHMLPGAHATLADVIFYYDWNWQGAEQGYLRSLDLNNSYLRGRVQYAHFLAAARRTSEAITQAQLIVDENPTSGHAHRTLGLMLYYDRQFTAAEEAIRRSLEFERHATGAWVLLGRIAEADGRLQEARQHTERAIELSGVPPVMLRIQQIRLQALAGEIEKAQADLEALRREIHEHSILWNPQFDAYVQLALGNDERALSFLEQAVEQRDPRLLWLAVDPRMDRIRDHPRFAEILRKLGVT